MLSSFKQTWFIILLISLFVFTCPAFADSKIDFVLVKKSEKKMFLLSKGKIIKQYKIALGANPKGHKQQEGDERTPEGTYVLDYKKTDSAFYKAIHISYPNKKDIERAKKSGVNPGGLIMIHGQKNGLGWLSGISQLFNWTDGCIALKNKDMDEVWSLVEAGTAIELQP